MNDKEYIFIEDVNGLKQKMEVILKYFDNKLNKNYIIYRNKDNTTDYFAASYIDAVGTVKLDHNLSEEELNLLTRFIDSLKENK